MSKFPILLAVLCFSTLVHTEVPENRNLVNTTLHFKESNALHAITLVYKVPTNYRCDTIAACIRGLKDIKQVPLIGFTTEQMILARSLAEKNIKLGYFDGMSFKKVSNTNIINYKFTDPTYTTKLTIKKGPSQTKLIVHRRVRE